MKYNILPAARLCKVLLLSVTAILLIGTLSFKEKPLFLRKAINETVLKEGDIIFQTSNSGQSLAVQKATHSKYSHCGILFLQGKDWYVYEAVQPVKKTILSRWIQQGDGSKYVVRRLKDDAVLTAEKITKMKEIYKGYDGKNYDLYFEWSDANLYCSELVWKLYKKGADIEVGELKKFGSFDLSSPEVKAIMKQRYGSNIPLDETVISPESIFNSELLKTVVEK